MKELKWSEAEYDALWARRDAVRDRESARLAAVVADLTHSAGADHPDTLLARRDLLLHLYHHDQHDDAVTTALIGDCLRQWGPEHQVTIAVQTIHAIHQIEQTDDRKREGAETLASLAAAQTRLLGQDHPDTLAQRRVDVHHQCRYFKLTLLRSREDLGQADVVHSAALMQSWADLVNDFARVLGPDHPGTLACRDEQAADYCEFGDHDLEGRCYAALAADRGRILGPDHPDTLHSRAQHVTSLLESGEDDAVARLRAELVADCLRVLGRDHEVTQDAFGPEPHIGC